MQSITVPLFLDLCESCKTKPHTNWIASAPYEWQHPVTRVTIERRGYMVCDECHHELREFIRCTA